MADEHMHEADHHHHDDTGRGGMGFLIGAVLLIAALFLFLYYGLPYLRGAGGGTQVNVPGQIDVNLNK